MMTTLHDALKRKPRWLAEDERRSHVIDRICHKARLPVRCIPCATAWAPNAALLGVNPRRMQSWMGDKRIDETMLYVHVARTTSGPSRK